MPDLPKIACIDAMVKVMGEKMTPEQARALFDEMVERTKAKAAKENIPVNEAAQKVAKEVAQEQKLNTVLQKRQALIDLQARNLMQTAALAKGDWAGAIIKFMQDVENMGVTRSNQFTSRFTSSLVKQGIGPRWKKANGLNVVKELEQLNFKAIGKEANPGFTGDEMAIAIANAYFPIRMDAQVLKNLYGANIKEAEGYIMLQTHSADRFRRAGKGMKLFAKESQSEAFKIWRTSLDGLNINWDRTLDGMVSVDRREDFLKEFFSAIYNKKHSQEAPQDLGDEIVKFKNPNGSLAKKLSSQRVFWFADAESAYKYNEQWGLHSWDAAILADLRSSGRNISLLQNMGTKPLDNLKRVVKDLQDKAANEENSQQLLKGLGGGGEPSQKIMGQYELTSGIADSYAGNWSRATNLTRNLVLSGKGTGIIFSAISDKAHINSRLAYEGISATDRFMEMFDLHAKTDPNFAASVGVFSTTMAGSSHSRWAEDVKPVLYSEKLVEMVMRYQGLNWWTDHQKYGVAMAISHHGLGAHANSRWEALPERRQFILDQYNITPAKWEAIRKSVQDLDGAPVITPDTVKMLADSDIDALLGGKPKTPANRERMRDELSITLGQYIHDAMGEAMNLPDAKIRSIRTLGGLHRNTIGRELAELFFIFKSFSLKTALTSHKRFSQLGPMGGLWHVASLITQGAVLGYLGMTAKDYASGRTRRKLLDDNGDINWSVWSQAALRGGGAAIYGDLLLNEYDNRYRSFAATVAGPALGELDSAAALFTKAKSVAGGETSPESLGLDLIKTTQNNLPLVNMFPFKVALDNLVWWQLKEWLSPGVFKKTNKALQRYNHQEFYIEPVD